MTMMTLEASIYARALAFFSAALSAAINGIVASAREQSRIYIIITLGGMLIYIRFCGARESWLLLGSFFLFAVYCTLLVYKHRKKYQLFFSLRWIDLKSRFLCGQKKTGEARVKYNFISRCKSQRRISRVTGPSSICKQEQKPTLCCEPLLLKVAICIPGNWKTWQRDLVF